MLAADDDLNVQEANLASVDRQLDQAQKRCEVGYVAVIDLEEARAAADSGTAAVIASKRQVASAQELLREITGETKRGAAMKLAAVLLREDDQLSFRLVSASRLSLYRWYRPACGAIH